MARRKQKLANIEGLTARERSRRYRAVSVELDRLLSRKPKMDKASRGRERREIDRLCKEVDALNPRRRTNWPKEVLSPLCRETTGRRRVHLTVGTESQNQWRAACGITKKMRGIYSSGGYRITCRACRKIDKETRRGRSRVAVTVEDIRRYMKKEGE